MMYYPQEAGHSVKKILRTIKALQYGSANRVAMLENWSNNELLGDDVIIPPTTIEALAEERRQTMKYNTDVVYKDWCLSVNQWTSKTVNS